MEAGRYGARTVPSGFKLKLEDLPPSSRKHEQREDQKTEKHSLDKDEYRVEVKVCLQREMGKGEDGENIEIKAGENRGDDYTSKVEIFCVKLGLGNAYGCIIGIGICCLVV